MYVSALGQYQIMYLKSAILSVCSDYSGNYFYKSTLSQTFFLISLEMLYLQVCTWTMVENLQIFKFIHSHCIQDFCG